MGERGIGGCVGVGGRHEGGTATGALRGLSLAAAPVFAIMALLTATQGGGVAEVLCSGGHGASPLGGMTLMYVLMSAVHMAPWLRLRSSSRKGAH